MNAETKLLLVDDSESVRVLVRLALGAEGAPVSVREAESGEEAVAIAQQWRPDAVVLDWYMPGMSGLQALGHIRRLLPASRIVMFSSESYASGADDARAHGADCYVEKSEGPLQLLDALGFSRSPA